MTLKGEGNRMRPDIPQPMEREPPEMSEADYKSEWCSWASWEIDRLRKCNETISSECADEHLKASRLQQEVTKLTELNRSLEKVLEARKPEILYKPGDTVYVGPDNTVKAQVFSVLVTKTGTVYKVGWWRGLKYETADLSASELSDLDGGDMLPLRSAE